MSDQSTAGPLPFSADKLDRYMEQAGIDTLVVSSKHNLAYLLGGHRHHFFEVTDAIGVSRYLPLLVYRKGRPDQAAYIANRNEKDAIANRALEGHPLWPATIRPAASGVMDATALAIDHIRFVGATADRIGIERSFLPWNAGQALAQALPQHGLADAHRPLERLRAVKSAQELDTLREASERVVGAMQAVMRSTQPGTSKRAIERALRREEEERGLIFEYALITIGLSLNRAPSDQACREGDIMSIDSGGNYEGYIGDVCRMAIQGEPDAELEDLLGEIETTLLHPRRGFIKLEDTVAVTQVGHVGYGDEGRAWTRAGQSEARPGEDAVECLCLPLASLRLASWSLLRQTSSPSPRRPASRQLGSGRERPSQAEPSTPSPAIRRSCATR